VTTSDGWAETSGYPDGTVLDVVIVDAEVVEDGCAIETVVATGDRKGELLSLRSPGLDLDPLDLLGLAGTVTIVDGQPRLAL